MRLHTNALTASAVRDALEAQESMGRIAQHVSFKALSERRSHSHTIAIEVQLEAATRDCGRRAGNSGSYGAMRPEVDGYAATYDEWGWLLAALYALDPALVVGAPKSPTYADRAHFHDQTSLSYDPDALIAAIQSGGDPYPYVGGQAARTKRGYLIGRQGANRSADGQTWWHCVERPRTVQDVRAFAFPLAVSA